MSEPLTIMVAPNGARRTKADHPAIPVTISQTSKVVAACAEAGASAAHVHVRNSEGQHLLDADAYSTLIGAIAREAPADFVCQITTEAVGRYMPDEQMAVVRAVRPRAVSIAVKELVPDEGAVPRAASFYEWCMRESIGVQHIVYDAGELERMISLARRGVIPGDRLSVLFVLGRYSADQQSDAHMLRPYLQVLDGAKGAPDMTWMLCAFGAGETACAAAAMALGGHVRVGFENSLWRPDGTVAADNIETVARARRLAAEMGRLPTLGAATLAVLGSA
ncbi:3-keto-5-aminohexanoate cleavage protein [Breoghania sp. JC706]|uniref:3-keto-5-aminohexanoate cleavage protein n=1 Tax=Breoghania sp. JC706 TaxID=3117732 RepID=UPI00300ABC97